MSQPPPTSYSPAGRFRIALDVTVRTLLVVAVMVMLNYLGAQFFRAFYLSSQTNTPLSSHTAAVLATVTNKVTITLYYDTHDSENFYSTLVELAKQYADANRNITYRTVDYVTDPGEAEKVKQQFDLPGPPTSPNAPPNKDLIIFSAGDRHDVVPGEVIVKTQLQATGPMDPTDHRIPFRRKPISFNGEVMFTTKLYALTHGAALKVYYLQGHGESSITDTGDSGFNKFGLQLVQNDLAVANLELLGDAEVPMDCSLLIIAAPVRQFAPAELQKIDRYLTQGGRLLVLFNLDSLRLGHPLGLEPILQHWGVNVVPSYVKDPQAIDDQGLIVQKFTPKTFVEPLTQLALEMILPRPVGKVDWSSPPPNAPEVTELAFSSDYATLAGDPGATARSYPLIVSVEQKPVAGVANPRGNTRIVVAGDSYFLDNHFIDAAANRDFINYAVNWLVDRQQLVAGIEPRPVQEYRILLTQNQQRQLFWLLLAGLPGAVLAVGWCVWFVRRK